ncbi:MAG: group 1 truncated hemoglobin [Porticoccaceae bacterium]|nr:group 1 truncated hemoglobin [Porticoccaceae bacterium]
MSSSILKSALLLLVLILSTGYLPAAFGQDDEAEPMQPTLYQRLGGLPAIAVVVDDLLDAVVPDPLLNENPAIAAARLRVPTPYLKYHVTAMVCQASGGPCTYIGGGMKESHAHLNITEAEWDRFVTIFKGILASHSVPEQEAAELLDIVESTRGDIVMVPESS